MLGVVSWGLIYVMFVDLWSVYSIQASGVPSHTHSTGSLWYLSNKYNQSASTCKLSQVNTQNAGNHMIVQHRATYWHLELGLLLNMSSVSVGWVQWGPAAVRHCCFWKSKYLRKLWLGESQVTWFIINVSNVMHTSRQTRLNIANLHIRPPMLKTGLALLFLVVCTCVSCLYKN